MYISPKNSSKGFTLIELLVVIAIIGLLASVVLASLNSARDKAQDARRLSDVKQVQLALELYYDVEGEYPDTSGGSRFAALEEELVPDYMPAIPMDPEAQSPGDTADYRYWSRSPYAGYSMLIQHSESEGPGSWCMVQVGDPNTYNPWRNGGYPLCSSL